MTRRNRSVFCATGLAFALAFAPSQGRAEFEVELDEFFIRIEMNATDGDVGLHTMLDGDGWALMQIKNPDGEPIYDLVAMNQLLEQGQTENFSESTEPPCFDLGEGEFFQTLAAFLERFDPGLYTAWGTTLEGETIGGTFLLSHELPAAPDISRTDGRRFEIDHDDDDGVTIRWRPGDDFGECSNGPGADASGAELTDEVDLWEVTVEPDEDAVEDADLPFTVFTVQLAPDQRRVDVPRQFFRQYLAAGIHDFKFEVGARKEQNQTFSEGEFTVRLDD